VAHDYWQFLLLPASAIAVALAFERLAALAARSRRGLYTGVAALAAVEILLTAGVTLSQRHLSPEAYSLETVEALRRDAL